MRRIRSIAELQAEVRIPAALIRAAHVSTQCSYYLIPRTQLHLTIVRILRCLLGVPAYTVIAAVLPSVQRWTTETCLLSSLVNNHPCLSAAVLDVTRAALLDIVLVTARVFRSEGQTGALPTLIAPGGGASVIIGRNNLSTIIIHQDQKSVAVAAFRRSPRVSALRHIKVIAVAQLQPTKHLTEGSALRVSVFDLVVRAVVPIVVRPTVV